MISFTFSVWELALLIIAIAFVVGTAYFVKMLKNLAETLNTSAKLIDENRVQLHNILNDVEEIAKNSGELTGKANQMVEEVETSVTALVTDVINPLVGSLSKVAKVAGVVAKKDKNKQ
ncbi:MAG: DUF948 domain-containing protein [Eubacterium sp.]|nr:DUF948 domain-containing protein [Eubacterium sp.]